MSLDLPFPDVWSYDFMPRHNFRYNRKVGFKVSMMLENNYPNGITRKDIVTSLNIPRTTIYDHLSLMIRFGIVYTKRKKEEKYKGRPITLFFLAEEPKNLVKKLMEYKI